jgi:hypothetical protein
LHVSTHTIWVHSSSPKSPIAAALAIHGFQTTAFAEPCAVTTSVRPPAWSATAIVPGWVYTRSVSAVIRSGAPVGSSHASETSLSTYEACSRPLIDVSRMSLTPR